MNNFEKIDRYLKGEMSAEELQAFEVELSANLELRKELFIQKAEEDALEVLAVKKLKQRIKKVALSKTINQKRIYNFISSHDSLWGETPHLSNTSEVFKRPKLNYPELDYHKEEALYCIELLSDEEKKKISDREKEVFNKIQAKFHAEIQAKFQTIKDMSIKLNRTSIEKIKEIRLIDYYSYISPDNRLYDAEIEKKLTLAFEAYETKNYKDALKLATFRLSPSIHWSYEFIQNELIGHCFLKLKSFYKASKSFLSLIKQYNTYETRSETYSVNKLQAKLLEWQWCFLLSYFAQAVQYSPLSNIKSIINEILIIIIRETPRKRLNPPASFEAEDFLKMIWTSNIEFLISKTPIRPDHPDFLQAEEFYKMIREAYNIESLINKTESLIKEILKTPDHPDYAQAEELYKMIQDAKNK